MFSCNNFNLSESPHLVSLTVADGGHGYTWIKIKCVGYMETGVKLVGKLVGGSLDSVKIIDGGNGIITVPTFEIEGDGSGAIVEVTQEAGVYTGIEGGSPVYENTTTVPNPECADGCIATTPPGTCDPTDVAPEPRPVCDPSSYSDIDNPDGTNERTCHSNTCGQFDPPILDNTYALKSPQSWTNFSTCSKRGYKNAFAKKGWYGTYGWCAPAPSQIKYLVQTTTYIYQQDDVTSCEDGGQHADITLTETITTNRYTGAQTTVRTQTGTRCVNIDFGVYETETIDDDTDLTSLWEAFINMTRLDASPIWVLDSCPLPSNTSTSTHLFDIASPCYPYTQDEVVSYAADRLFYSLNNTWPRDCGANFSLFQSAEKKLTSPYTPADVISDAKELLAMIDLCDDMKLPWRTDVPILNLSPIANYSAQEGYSFGPMAYWAADADGNPIVRGVPNPIGYEPFFDSLHDTHQIVECSPDIFGFQNTFIGEYCPTKYGTATAWMEDFANNTYEPGAHASFASPRRTFPICEGDSYFESGTYYCSKWALQREVFPHHDPARPCGEDATTIDPDTVCDETPSKLFPGAPEECTGSDTSPKGSYTISQTSYLSGVFASALTCCTWPKSPCKQALFIQDEEPSGIYTGCTRIDPPSITFFDERTTDGVPQGDSALVQVWLARVDPLWQRPATAEIDEETEECTAVPDDTAVPPLEENTDCADVDCGATLEDSRCQPGNSMFWLEQDEVGI
jgi:hypothetical protein